MRIAIVSRCALLLLCFLTAGFSCFGFSSAQQKKLTQAQSLLQSSNGYSALILCEDLKKSLSTNTKDYLEVVEFELEIYFFMAEFRGFFNSAKEAYELKKSKHPIFEAEYQIRRAMAFHYVIIPDSVLNCVQRADAILQQYPLSSNLLDMAFYYMVKANSELYRYEALDGPDFQKRLDKDYLYGRIFENFKKAESHFFRDKRSHPRLITAIYRSWGNRWLDRVTEYKILSPDQLDKIRPLQRLCANKVRYYYQKALDYCSPQNIDDALYVQSLLGFMEMTLRDFSSADKRFVQAIAAIQKQYGALGKCPYIKLMSSLLGYKITLDIERKAEINICRQNIQWLKECETEYWKMFNLSPLFRYDSYASCPTVSIANLWMNISTQKLSYSEKSELVETIVRQDRLLCQYQSENQQWNEFYTHMAEKEGMVQAVKKIQDENYKLFQHQISDQQEYDVKMLDQIQQRLSDDEIVILYVSNKWSTTKRRVVVAKNQIEIVDIGQDPIQDVGALDSVSMEEFISQSKGIYKQSILPILKKFPWVKRMIVSYKDPIPYESVVVNDNAKNWDDAHFLIENIEVTRIYNSYRFFRDPQKSLSPRIQFVQFNQSGMDDIPFTQSWANQMREDQEASILQANERPWLDVLSKPGIVHLFGHGKWQNSNIDFPKTFFIPAAGGGEYLSRSNLDIGPKINLDLLVLQHCYSGKEDKYIKHYDTQLFQNMLYLGAGAVVSSITAITDESSAWIMDEFYRSMKNGMTATQALCNAKRLYLSSHHGSGRDPRMWAALTLTSNVELVQEEESIWYRLWKWLTGLFQ